MDERTACTLLKSKFETAGLRISENVWFEAEGVRFEIDGYDAERRVGYEYVTEEAGDGWDVDADVIARLDELRDAGTYHVLVVSEADAPDSPSLEARVNAFLAALPAADSTPSASPSRTKRAKSTRSKPTARAAKKAPAKKAAVKKTTAKSKR